MADRKFQIEVSTAFNPAGTQAASAALGDVTKSTGKLNEVVQEGSGHADKLHLSHRALHQILHLIARESGPGAGAAIAGIGSLAGGGIMIAIMAVKELVEWLHKLNEKAQESAEVWIKQQEAIKGANQQAEDFARAIERAHDSQKELNNEFEKQKSVLDAQIEGHKKLLELIEKEQLAAAGGDKDKQESVRSRFEELKRGSDLAAEEAKLRQQEDFHGVRSQRQPQLDAAAASAESTYQGALKNPGAVELKHLLDSQDGTKIRAAYEKTVKGIDSETGTQIRNLQFSQAQGKLSPEEAQSAIEEAKAAAESKKAGDKDIQAFEAYENQSKAYEEHTKKVNELKDSLDQAVKARDENTKALEEETTAITKGRAVLDQHKKDASQQNAFTLVDRAGGFANAGNIIAAGVSAEAAIGSGQHANAQQAQQIATMHALFQAVGGNGTLIIQILRQSLAHHATQAQQILELQQQFATLKSAQMRGSRSGQ